MKGIGTKPDGIKVRGRRTGKPEGCVCGQEGEGEQQVMKGSNFNDGDVYRKKQGKCKRRLEGGKEVPRRK